MPTATDPKTGETIFLDADGAWKPAQTAVNPETGQMLAFDGRGWDPVPASKGVFTYIDDAVRSIATGITFGWADEFAAKMDESLGRGTYAENLTKEQARDAQIPVAIQLPGEIAGAVGSSTLLVPMGALKALVATGGRLKQAATFGTLGAAEGALAGAGTAKEGERLSGAATGAAVGAGVGAAAPTVINAAVGTGRAIRNAVSPVAGAQADLARAVVRDGDTPAAFADRFIAGEAQRPGQTTIADVGGENVRGLVERVAQTPGAGRTQVVPALTKRQEGQLGRVTNDLRELTGTAKTAREAVDETIAARATAAKPLYDEAMGFDLASSPEAVEAFLRATRTGWGKAIMESEGFRRALQTEHGIEGAPGREALMAVFDAWKKEADDLVGAAKRSGDNNKARIISRMRDDVLGAVDQANPAYARAREAWSGPSAFLDAVEEGRTILKSGASSDEVIAKLAKMTDDQKEAFRIGAVSGIIGRMGNDPAKLADMTKYLRSPEVRAKIAAMMPTPEAAQAWTQRLEAEVKSSELVGRSLGNSATFRRTAEAEDAKGVVGDLVLDAMTGNATSVGFLRRIFTAGPRWLRDTLRSRTDKELADLLVNPDRAADLPAVIQRMQQQRRAGATSPTAAAAATAGTIAAYE